MKEFFRLLFAPDPGAAGSTVAADPKQGAADPAPADPPKADPAGTPVSADAAELAKVKKELDELKTAKAAEEKARKDAELAKMSDDERKAAEAKEMQESLVRQNRTLQLKKAGIEEKYLPLVSGATTEEIEQSGTLLSDLIAKVKAEAVADVKKGIAQTGTPGKNDGTGTAVDSATFYKNILGVK